MLPCNRKSGVSILDNLHWEGEEHYFFKCQIFFLCRFLPAIYNYRNFNLHIRSGLIFIFHKFILRDYNDNSLIKLLNRKSDWLKMGNKSGDIFSEIVSPYRLR